MTTKLHFLNAFKSMYKRRILLKWVRNVKNSKTDLMFLKVFYSSLLKSYRVLIVALFLVERLLFLNMFLINEIFRFCRSSERCA